MISRLARDLTAQTEEYARLQKLVSQAEAVRTTEELLEEIDSILGKWAAVFPVIEPLLTAEQVAEIRRDAAAIVRQLANSQQEFANHHFQQATKLTQLRSKAERLRGTTKDAWSEYARRQAGSLHDLVLVAQRLPKMAPRMDAIHSYIASLQKHATDLPSKPQAVEQFHAHLTRLEELLSDLEGLPNDVRVFVRKLVNGEATFADVTTDVFAWCHAEGLADRLKFARL